MTASPGPGEPKPIVDARDGHGTQIGDHDQQTNQIIHNYFENPEGRGTSRPEPGPLIVGDVPQEPPAFQPRADLLVTLARSGPGVSVVQAVTGMRGVGKTQLAAAYARSRISEGWRLVAWVDAGDSAAMLKGLAEASDRLAIGEPGQDLNSKGAMVRHWLEADGERCLVVFNNVNDLDGVRPFVPAAGKSQVVITSTRQMASALARRVAVDVFTEDEALSFLHERTGDKDAEGAAQLAAELGWLPLALAHAGAVIVAQHLSYGTYLNRLRPRSVSEYPARSEGEPYPRGVAEAVLLSLDAVSAADGTGLCGAVMEMVSLLSTAGVQRTLLYAAGHIGVLLESPEARIAMPPHAVDEALGRLAGASLLTFSVDGTTVSAHRLVMRVVRERLARSDGLAKVASTIIGLFDVVGELLNPIWQHRSAIRDLIQQITALNEHIIPFLATDSAVIEWVAVLRWSLKCLVELGDSPAQAVEHGKLLVPDLERLLGPDHPHTLGSRANLAAAYKEARAEPPEAIPLLERTVTDAERILGPDNRDTLVARATLAEAYRQAGRIAENISLLERTLPDVERILGPDHPDALTMRGHLALAYLQAGRATEAIRLLEPDLTKAERTFEPDSPALFRIRANLAAAYDQAGQTADAITLLERALTDAERTLGPDKPPHPVHPQQPWRVPGNRAFPRRSWRRPRNRRDRHFARTYDRRSRAPPRPQPPWHAGYPLQPRRSVPG